jgi:hypothetical protein
MLHLVLCVVPETVYSTLEENIQSYAWSYERFPIMVPGKEPDTFVEKTRLLYPPHAVWNDLPGSERKQMKEIFDPDLVDSIAEIRGGEVYFRLPYEKDLGKDWTLQQLAESNRDCYRLMKEKCAEDNNFDKKLNPLLKNNIGACVFLLAQLSA